MAKKRKKQTQDEKTAAKKKGKTNSGQTMLTSFFQPAPNRLVAVKGAMAEAALSAAEKERADKERLERHKAQEQARTARRMEPLSPRRKEEIAQAHRRHREEQQQFEIRQQVEYYLSDKALRRDDFYRSKILASNDGWFSMDYIMTAPRIKNMKAEIKLVANAMQTSQSVETKQEGENNFLIRRKNNKALPKKQASYSSYRKRRNRWRDDYDNDSDYGFSGGSHGYSGYDCDRLLECGVKPWEDGAGHVLGALYDY